MTAKAKPDTPPQLNGRHQHTYEAIFRHPTAHNLEWHDVLSLLEALADVSEGNKGSIHVTRNGQMMTLPAPKHKDVASVEQLLEIRHFLEKSGEIPDSKPATAATDLHR
jgi:hypothetical protein